MSARRVAPLAFVIVFFALAGSAQAAGQLMAGAAAIDANWHVGASAGQYASTADPTSGEFDPYNHSIKNKPSYGTQSRLQVRAIVFQEAGGKKVAMAKTDMYIPQDLLWRRAAQILAARHIGIDKSNLTMTITHDHSSPYYSSTAPGVWTFQDVFDVRFFNYYAHKIADAVTLANSRMKPARMGASVMKYDKPQRNALGPTVADDGTPAGFPNSYTDHEMIVLRFDEAGGSHRSIATFIDYELHGEGLNGNDLISGDFVAPLQRMVDRRTGGVAYYAQNAVGTTEPERSPDYHKVHERLDFVHREYGQNEYEAAGIAGAVLHLWGNIGRGRPEKGNESRFVPFTTRGPVSEHDQFFPGPPSHPYPAVSSCRTDQAFHGDPRIPAAGLPDCEQFSTAPHAGLDVIGVPFDYNIPTVDPGITENDFKSRGIPVPDNLGVPSSGALEEDIGIHLQAFRLGPVSFTVCSCEQWADQSMNIKTRTDHVAGDEYLGFDWSKLCRHQGDGTYRADGTGTGHWICPNPQIYSSDDPPPDKTLPPLSDQLVEHMRAQVLNPANGWDAPSNVTAESEPTDLTKIKGNYTHDDTTQFAPKLTVPISMANDYNGYIATYREFQRGDHYRKALTGWGPHSSDYLATRLVRMVRELNGGPPLPTEVLQSKEIADNLSSDQRASALGNAETAEKGYEASLPDDGGKPGPLTQPKDIQRFSAATFSWLGGSNFTDNPTVRVERRVGHRWTSFADQSGEIPVTVKFPQTGDAAPFLAGNQKWKWTASFEAFVSRYDLISDKQATPAGTYRFVADGSIRHGRRPVPYRVISRSFAVSPWRGLRAQHLRRSDGGAVLFSVGPGRTIAIPKDDTHPATRAAIGPIDYPDSYSSPTRFVKNERSFIRDPAAPNDPKRFEWYCVTCSFRPWLDAGSARSATVTVVSRSRRVRHVRAVRRGTGWIARGALHCGDKAYVGTGATRDPFGNLNGVPSATISAGALVDRTSPRSRLRLKTLHASRTSVAIRGISNDTGGCHAGVRRVQIELVKKNPLKNKLCRYVLKSGRLSRERSCDRPLFLSARGTNNWRFALKVSLPRGYYRLRARAVDRVGNREHPRSPARTRFLLR